MSVKSDLENVFLRLFGLESTNKANVIADQARVLEEAEYRRDVDRRVTELEEGMDGLRIERKLGEIVIPSSNGFKEVFPEVQTISSPPESPPSVH